MKGGLGNQLFQYAAGLSLSTRFHGELVLDTVSGFTDDRFGRRFELGRLGARWRDASPAEMVVSRELARVGRHRALNMERTELPGLAVLREGCDLYQWKPTRLRPRRVFLDGYWQNPRFFPGDPDFIRRAIDVESFLPDEEDLLALARQPKSVAVHFRFFSMEDPKNPVDLGLDYYARALSELVDKLNKPEVLLFSDNVLKAEKLLRRVTPSEVAITVAECGNHLADFALMSICHNFVIANSTFSWWAAWIGAGREGLVTYPRVESSGGNGNLANPLLLSNWNWIGA